MPPKLLVIIVTYNPMQWVDRCLNSIRQSSFHADVMVIDNGSSDGSQEYIKVNYQECIFIQNSSNKGFGAANNIGLRYALSNDYDYVYLLNQDAWVKENTFQALIEEQQANPQFGIISPIQIQANERHLDTNFLAFASKSEDLIESSIFRKKGSLFESPFIMAAHWLISRKCLETVGLFSPSFIHYGEDDNYCDRALFHGFRIGFTTKAYAIHDRENRPTDKKKKLYLENTRRIVLLSRPNGINYSFLFMFKDCMLSMRKNRSFAPAWYLLSIAKNWSEMQKNKETSKGTGAFL